MAGASSQAGQSRIISDTRVGGPSGHVSVRPRRGGRRPPQLWKIPRVQTPLASEAGPTPSHGHATQRPYGEGRPNRRMRGP